MRRLAATLVLLAACAPAARGPAAASAPAPAASAWDEMAASVSPEALRRDLYIVAADSFNGRDAIRVESVRAAEFIANRMQQLGLEPAGDSGYFQRVPLTRQGLGANTSFQVATGAGSPATTTDIPLGEGLVPLLSLGPGAPLPRLEANGDVVFAGYGVRIPELGRDDLAGLNVAGRVVVVVNGAPAGLTAERTAELEGMDAIGQRVGPLLQQGPAAIIVLLAGSSGDEYGLFAQDLGQGSVSLREGAPTDGPRQLPMVLLGRAAAGSPLLPAGWPADDKPQPLANRRFQGRVEVERTQHTSYNVVAVARGSDPQMNRTYVALGAHLDHIGVVPPVNGDSIGNGADDDGSGVVALMAAAEAWQRAPRKPRRSLLFVWHTAEEKGLLGSEWFTNRPTVPIDSIVAHFNADMIGRNHPDSLYLVGPRAAPNNQSRMLGQIVDSVNTAATRFLINREWDSPTHPERIYYRSDHYNYARRGVPVVFFTTGLHDDYHKPSDTPDKIDYDKLARVTRLLLLSAAAVAERPTRPVSRSAR